MQSKKPRLTVTFEPEIYKVISDYSELTGLKKGKVVNELLEPAVEHLGKVVSMLEGVKTASDEVKKQMLNNMVDYEESLLTGLLGGLEGVRDEANKRKN